MRSSGRRQESSSPGGVLVAPMPITRDELNRGRTKDSLEDQVSSFMTRNSSSGYTTEEVAVGIGLLKKDSLTVGTDLVAYDTRAEALRQVERVLDDLVDRRKLVRVSVQDKHGYSQTHYGTK